MGRQFTFINTISAMNDMHKTNISSVDLHSLKVFHAIYEEASATRAGARLGMTQSGVSAALARLRVLYGDPLFQRTGRGLSPTLRAHELQPLIAQAIAALEQSLALHSAHAQKTPSYAGRSLVIGMSDDFEMALSARLLALCQQHLPGLRLAFRQTHSNIVAEMLIARSMDVAIVSGGLHSGLVQQEWLGHGSYACLVDAASLTPAQDQAQEPAQKAPALTERDYLSREHILVSSNGFTGIVDDCLAQAQKKRTVIASTSHFSALPFLLKGTQAVATLPRHAAQALDGWHGLAMLPCPIRLPKYPIVYGWRTSAARDPMLAQFQQIAVQAVQAMALAEATALA